MAPAALEPKLDSGNQQSDSPGDVVFAEATSPGPRLVPSCPESQLTRSADPWL
jgi:hypothetical protein